MLVYLDTSALTRLVGNDGGAAGLMRYLGSDPSLVTCRVVEAELPKETLFAVLAMREVDSTLMRSAAELVSDEVDLAGALHLAAALELRRELEAFITYDEGCASAARALRLPVVSPS